MRSVSRLLRLVLVCWVNGVLTAVSTSDIIFVNGWDVTASPLPFPARNDLIAEVKQVRVDHNLTPDTAIEATAWAVRRCTNTRDFERVLAQLPDEAAAFWHVDVDDPTELEQRIL